MSPRISHSWSVRPWCRPAFPLWLLIAAVACGCSGGSKTPSTAEVSGKVTFNGQPVPGGMITFVATKGGFSSGGKIDENGMYKVPSAPVGEVKITVDNSMLMGKGRGAPAQGPMLKRPGAEQAEEMKGHYIDLPAKYAQADKTDLTYTVVSGAQTKDIELK
jgi:hypothetical protein